MLKKLLSVMLVWTAMVAGCGQKGPLVLPPPEGAEVPQQQDQSKVKK